MPETNRRANGTYDSTYLPVKWPLKWSNEAVKWPPGWSRREGQAATEMVKLTELHLARWVKMAKWSKMVKNGHCLVVGGDRR